jgi:uncharacterized protein YbcV (DUF1398 family)
LTSQNAALSEKQNQLTAKYELPKKKSEELQSNHTILSEKYKELIAFSQILNQKILSLDFEREHISKETQYSTNKHEKLKTEILKFIHQTEVRSTT